MRLAFLLLLIPLVFIAQRIFVHPTKPSVNIIHTKPTPTSTNSPSPSSTPIPSQSISSYPILPSHPTSQPIPTTQTSSVNLNDFTYPGASQAGSSGNTLTLQTSDDAQTVTDWYKNKIQSLGWNTTSSIQNNTNGNVSNQLVASNGSKEVRVQITKSNNSSTVSITVNM